MPSEPQAADPAGARLHPASLLFSIGSAAWKLLIPGLVLIVAASGRTTEIVLMVMFLPAVVMAVARYLSFSYRLGPDELVIRQGILTRSERHIPYARIQNIDLVQNPLHRLLRVAEIRIETASGEEPEANIQVLSLHAVERMRERVFADRRAPAAAPDGVGAESALTAAAGERDDRAPRRLFGLGLRDVMLFGVISNRGLAVVLALWGLAWQLPLETWAPDWAEPRLERWLAAIAERVDRSSLDWASPLLTAGMVVGLLLVFLLALRVISVGWAVVKLYGFTLARAGDDLRTSYGLITRLSATVPRRRIQLLTLRETLLHRLFGRLELRVVTAGGSQDNEHSGVGRQLLVPLLRRTDVSRLLREVQPEIDLDALAWQPVHPRAWRRILVRLLVVSLALLALATAALGPRVWLALPAVVPLAFLAARATHRSMRYAVADGHVAYRSGWWVRRLSVARYAKLQVVALGQNPFDRRLEMASVRADTAGAGQVGHRIGIPYLGMEAARRVFERLSLEAARTAFRW